LVEISIVGTFWIWVRWPQEYPKGCGWRWFSLGRPRQVGGDRKIPQGMVKEF